MALRHRLGGLVRAAEGPCPFKKEDGNPCSGTADTYGRHTLCCSYGGFMVKRHNNLRDTIARALREAGICDIAVEPWIRPPSGPGNPGLRADLTQGEVPEEAVDEVSPLLFAEGTLAEEFGARADKKAARG